MMSDPEPKFSVPLNTDMSRFGWGDFAELAGSVVLGYFLDAPSIPIDVALSKLGGQLVLGQFEYSQPRFSISACGMMGA